MAYKMVKENVNYDLCELLRQQLLVTLQLMKTNLYPFCYGSLIVCLLFYFLSALPRLNNIV